MEWTGRVIFGEKWASAKSDEEAEESMLHTEIQGLERRSRGRDACHRPSAISPVGSVRLPGDLVLRDIPEKNIADDLSGKPLDGVRVTAAKTGVGRETDSGLLPRHREAAHSSEMGGDEQG